MKYGNLLIANPTSIGSEADGPSAQRLEFASQAYSMLASHRRIRIRTLQISVGGDPNVGDAGH